MGTVGANNDEWLRRACDAIQSRVDKYGAAEIRFNLLAIVKDRRNVYQEQLNTLQSKKTQLQQTLTSSSASTAADTSAMTDVADHDSVNAEIAFLDTQIREITGLIADEKLKFDRWSAENIRRKHNYLPFIYQLLRRLAKENKLQPLIQQASKDTADRNERIKAAAAATAKSKKAAAAITSASTNETTMSK